MKKKDHYRDLYFSGQTDAYKQRQTKPTKEKNTCNTRTQSDMGEVLSNFFIQTGEVSQ